MCVSISAFLLADDLKITKSVKDRNRIRLEDYVAFLFALEQALKEIIRTRAYKGA